MFQPAPQQPDFAYELAPDGAVPVRAAIFGEDEGLRRRIMADCAGAGLRGIDGGSVRALLEGPVAVLGEVVLVDCPGEAGRGLGGMMLAGLARLDERAARSGAKLIVLTNLAGLDEAFAVLDRAAPQILVEPSRAEVVIAVGRAMSEAGAARVRELADEDRAALLRLSEQVEAIAHSLDRIGQAPRGAGGGSAALPRGYPSAGTGRGTGGAVGALCAAPPLARAAAQTANIAETLPDPALVRLIIANRQARARFFDPALFGDPAWDMLLDLTAAQGEGVQVSVTSLCIAAGVPATTALRWLTQMVESGVFVRVPDPADRRRAFIALSERAVAGMAGYFAQVQRAPEPVLVM